MTDVQKKLGDLFVHYGKVISGSININDSVELKIDIKEEMILELTIQQLIYCTSL